MSKFLIHLFFCALTGVGLAKAPAKQSGFKMQSVDPGSALAAFGIEPGDVIVSINGKPTHTLQAIQEAIVKMQEQDSGVITVLRDGKPVNLNFRVK